MNENRKVYQDSIADTMDHEQVLKGILPKNMIAYRVYKTLKTAGLIFLALAAFMFGLTFVKVFVVITRFKIYRLAILGLTGIAVIGFLLMGLIRLIFLRRAPFDDWLLEIASKRLGTDLIFYDSKYIYMNYDRAGREVDKREFITEMSDKSVNYSYFYIKTYIDRGFIQVECKKRQPIPNVAPFKEEDDKYWNIIPLGLTINNLTQQISPVGWKLNNDYENPEFLNTNLSVSMLIAGETGCYIKNLPIPMYDTLLKHH